jgi:hypothetical protein
MAIDFGDPGQLLLLHKLTYNCHKLSSETVQYENSGDGLHNIQLLGA